MAKPTGTSGYFQAQMSVDGKVVGSFEAIPLSKEKTEVEKHMVERFIASMIKYFETTDDRFFMADPQLNPQDDFDFTVASPNGPAYLELMEIAPLTGPYEQALAEYKPYDFGEAILSGILKKSSRYPKNIGRDIYLLLYVTHWSFALSDIAIACLRYWLRVCSRPFSAQCSRTSLLMQQRALLIGCFPFHSSLSVSLIRSRLERTSA